MGCQFDLRIPFSFIFSSPFKNLPVASYFFFLLSHFWLEWGSVAEAGQCFWDMWWPVEALLGNLQKFTEKWLLWKTLQDLQDDGAGFWGMTDIL